jgi:hypothetical protein
LYLKNEDLEIMCDVEELLHKKLVQTNGIKDVYKGKEYYYFNENDKEVDLWDKYWNMIEKLLQRKAESNKKNYEKIKEKRKKDKNYARRLCEKK